MLRCSRQFYNTSASARRIWTALSYLEGVLVYNAGATRPNHTESSAVAPPRALQVRFTTTFFVPGMILTKLLSLYRNVPPTL